MSDQRTIKTPALLTVAAVLFVVGVWALIFGNELSIIAIGGAVACAAIWWQHSRADQMQQH